MSEYKLSASLEGHSDDIKAIVSPFNDTIVSCSRDSTVLVWNKDSGIWNSKLNYKSNGFVNSLAYDSADNLVISGGQDHLISLTDVFSSSIDPKFVLLGHESNVCSLDYNDDQIISGSWDSTAKVWENNQLKYTLTGHNASVWDVKIISKDQFLTASADKTIRLWNQDKEVRKYVGHADVIRSLALLPDGSGFASASNDGTIRITKFNGDLVSVLSGHESFVYSIKFLNNGDLVSSGEDRTVRIWRNNQCIQVITIPSLSIWTVSVLPNDDIATGGSDSIIRIFTKDPERIASEAELSEFKKEVESIAINSQEFNESKVSSPEVLNQPGKKEGQIVVVKSEVGINEAYSWSNNQWNKVGEVVSGPSNDKKVEFQGAKWDFVFDVDVNEGQPPLKLPYNLSENPYTAAQRFLEQNELSPNYTEEVVNFITKNTQGVNIGTTTTNPYYDSKPKNLPQLNYLTFLTDNSAAILKGINKINSTEEKFTEAEIVQIEEWFKSKDYTKLSEIAIKIIETWDNKLPGFDILRLAISKLDSPISKLGEILKIGLNGNKNSNTIYFMTFRLLSNVFINSTWGEAIITDNSISHKIIQLIDINDELEGKALENLSNAISTLILNFTIYIYKYKVNELGDVLYKKLIEIGIKLSKSSSESAYRTLVAWGNLISLNVKFRDTKYQEFKNSVKYNESRFKDLFEEIEGI